MKVIKTIILAVWVISLIALYAYLFWDRVLIEDPEQERMASILKEYRKERSKLYENSIEGN